MTFARLLDAARSAFTAFQQPFIRNYVRLAVQDTAITAKESFDFWRSKGAPFHVCWSLLGNEQRETGFNWTAVGDRGTAHGIAQWHGARAGDIQKAIGIDVKTAGHKGQLAAMYWEMTAGPKPYGKVWNRLLATQTVQQACDILVRDYERAAQTDRDIKLQIGFANDLRAKHPDWETQMVPPLVVSTPMAVPVPPKASPPVPEAAKVAAALPVVAAISKPVTAPAIITKAKGAFPTQLTKAGSFNVVQDPCPHFSTAVDLKAPRAGVLHTTEGYWAGAMGVFKQHFAPHFLVGLNTQKKPQISQLVPVGVIGAALKANNNLAIVQIEMVSFSKEKLWLPDSGTLDALCELMNACQAAYGIPLSYPWKDDDFGKAGNNPHRSSGKFGKTAGWFSHGDVPAPDTHWDAGALQWSKVFARAKQLAAPSLVA